MSRGYTKNGPVTKRFTQADGMVTNALPFDDPVYTLGRGRMETRAVIGRNGAFRVERDMCPPSQAKPEAGSGIFRAYDKPKGGR